MAELKKIKSASLVENLVATALLVLIFTMATASLHHFYQKSFKRTQRNIGVDFNRNYYHYSHGKIQLPLQYQKNNLQYHFDKVKAGETFLFVLTVKDSLDKTQFKNHRALQNLP